MFVSCIHSTESSFCYSLSLIEMGRTKYYKHLPVPQTTDCTVTMNMNKTPFKPVSNEKVNTLTLVTVVQYVSG